MRHFLRAALLAGFAVLAAPSMGQVNIDFVNTAFTQNFNSLPSSGPATTWVQNSTILGWYGVRTGTGTTLVVDTGSSNSGNLYSYGTASNADRALGSIGSANATAGSFFYGVRLKNNTGVPITSLQISYVGEQWRNSAAAAQTVAFSYLVGSPAVTGSLAEFQSAGTAVPALNFTGPITGGAAGALNGNLAANRVAISSTIFCLSIPDQIEVMLRWSDPDHSGSDHGLSIDDFSVVANPAGANPPVVPTCPSPITTEASVPASGGLSASDCNGTVTSASMFSITPSAAPGTIALTSFTPAAVVGGTATATLSVDDSVPVGGYAVVVRWSNDDGSPQTADCGVTVNVTTPPVLTPIRTIQGSGTTSPLVGTSLTTRGIVTGVKSNGFFLQEPDATIDADPNTSEGIFVFTSSAPPAAAAVGNRVQVAGTVSEFVPSADPSQPPLTELASPTVRLLSTGNPLPTPVTIVAGDTSPSGTMQQLERFEGMRVKIDSLTVVAPTQGSTNEPNATGSTNGVFFGVVTGVTRPVREAGVPTLTPLPTGSPANVPRWDENPELLRVDGDGLVGAPALNLSSGAVLTNLVGPLDYAFRRYTVLPDPASPPVVTPGIVATAVSDATRDETTIGSYNLERFFDDNNDGIGEPVLTGTAFQNRLGKASRQIRDFLKFPDILGVVEVENIATLQALATRINGDAVAAAQPDPLYVAYLEEGNDIGGIDVGFLVKTAVVTGSTPRISVTAVVQEGKATTWPDPTVPVPPLLNDRPPLRLMATVSFADGRAFPVTVIVNHLRSLNGVAEDTANGDRVRRKRQAQSEFLANLVQARQVAASDERIVLVGDFNAFEVNDGYADVMGTIIGSPVPADQVAINVSNDLVSPDLVNLWDTPLVGQRYGYSFDGHAQNLDHVLVNAALVGTTTARRVEHPRLNADFPQTDRSNYAATDNTRLSDHDAILGFLSVPPIPSADLSVTKVDATDPILPGGTQTWTITVQNAGPDPAANATLTDILPAGILFQSVTPPAGWACPTTPAVGANGTVGCSSASVAVGGPYTFTLAGSLDGTILPGATVSNTATVGATTADPDSANNSHQADTAVRSPSLLSATKTVSGTFLAGSTVTYTIVIANTGNAQGDYAGDEMTDVLPATLTLVSANASSGTAVANLGTNTVTWNGAIPASGSVTVTIAASLIPLPAGFGVENQATIRYDADGDSTNDASTLSDDPTVGGSADKTTFRVRRGFFPVTPCRAYDSRLTTSLAAGEERAISMSGAGCGVMANADTVSLNVTVTQATAAGDVRGDAFIFPIPQTSILSFKAGATRANNALVRLSSGGQVKLENDSAGTVHVIVDVNGYFR